MPDRDPNEGPYAAYWRLKARSARNLAASKLDRGAKATFEKIAELYEQMAAAAERREKGGMGGSNASSAGRAVSSGGPET